MPSIKALPLVRMACLLDARARLLVDASMDAYDTSEYTLAERLWPRQLPADSLVIVDKGFTQRACCGRCSTARDASG